LWRPRDHSDYLETLLSILRSVESEGPLFHAPWQAKIFALMVTLVKNQHLPWRAFQKRLIEEIRLREQCWPAPMCPVDVEDNYHGCWLVAAERTLKEEGFVADADIAAQLDTIRKSVESIRSTQKH